VERKKLFVFPDRQSREILGKLLFWKNFYDFLYLLDIAKRSHINTLSSLLNSPQLVRFVGKKPQMLLFRRRALLSSSRVASVSSFPVCPS